MASRLRDLPLWRLPPEVLTFVLGTYAVTGFAALFSIMRDKVSFSIIIQAALVTFAGIAFSEISAILRKTISLRSMYPDLSTIWTFAPTITLPPFACTIVVIGIEGYTWLRRWRAVGSLYRHIFSTATIALGTMAASSILSDYRHDQATWAHPMSLVWILIAGLAYLAINGGLVATAIILSNRSFDLMATFGRPKENLFECVGILFGAVTGIALSSPGPLLVLSMICSVTWPRSLFSGTLYQASMRDETTGLLTIRSWRDAAARMLRRWAATTDDQPRRIGLLGRKNRTTNYSAAVLVVTIREFDSMRTDLGQIAAESVVKLVAEGLMNVERQDDGWAPTNPMCRYAEASFALLILTPRNRDADFHSTFAEIRNEIETSYESAIRSEAAYASLPRSVTLEIGYAASPAQQANIGALLIEAQMHADW